MVEFQPVYKQTVAENDWRRECVEHVQMYIRTTACTSVIE